MRSLDRLKRPARHLRSVLRRRTRRDRLEIMVYHSISDSTDAFTLSGHTVGIRAFREQIDYLAQHYRVVGIGQTPALMAGDLAEDGPFAAITFDDGYRNNLTEAYPVLEELKLPATVFVCPPVLGNGDLLWRDKVRLLISRNLDGAFVEYLQERRSTGPYRFDRLTQQSFYNWSKDAASIGDMTIQGDLSDFLAICDISAAGFARAQRLFLDESDIRPYEYLAFGNHTCSHPIMSCLDVGRQRAEVVGCERFLAARGISSAGLALPFSPYNRDTLAVCREVGYDVALTVYGGSRPNIVGAPRKEGVYVLHRRMAPRDLATLRQYV